MPDADDSERRAQAVCPICGKLTETRWRPFCSKRCADVDLHRWLSGGYVIPAAEEAGEDAGENAGDERDADTERG